MAKQTWYVAATFAEKGVGKGEVRVRMTGLPKALAKRIYNGITNGSCEAWLQHSDEPRLPFSWSMGMEERHD